ncbi:protein CNGC15b-like [Papaver somniferum]|uniref:protein CNGC15b-like n=1 Tax=Papaver somniferum TaxID=3469 RepID=UPI000E6F76BA|nr:protein CNGC15b-like [Papaver somniferum]XP_026417776.1 protein CNGC15b-like [Papaver somniferum]
MAYISKSIRFQDNQIELKNFQRIKAEDVMYKSEKEGSGKNGKSLKSLKVLSRVFSEDYERVKQKILDPRGLFIRRWNKIFLAACLVSLFVDPLFFYLPTARTEMCIYITVPLEVVLTIIRSIADVFYMVQIFVRFRTAFVAPSSRVFGRGELVIDPSRIASRYLAKEFCIELVAALPLPQILLWAVIPNLSGVTMTSTKNVLRFSIIFQFIPRLFLIFPLSSQIVKATGVVTKTEWAGAAYNLMLYMLASHVIGACWYLLSIERQESCWREVCDIQSPECQSKFIDCDVLNNPSRVTWYKSSNITRLCDPRNNLYQFGIYADALNYGITTSSPFFKKYFYCLWWGLKNLSSLGQNLLTSTYVGEICFAIVIAILGLVLFGLLIGNMQTYLQSTTIRLEEWRIKRRDTEEWMRHRQLPKELRECVRRYNQYKWVATRGVDEEYLLKGLPMDLRRDIKRHLCLDLVRRVPLFDQMDERMLDAICERLKPGLCTQGTCLLREGDPVNEMLFVIRGHLDSCTTNGGRTGFFNSCRIGSGDFCGEELLTWVLDPRPSVILPSSTRTVKAIGEVEAFALSAEDLKFVASQFRRLHSKQIRHKFRFYSHHWRTWAACFIQVAWRRFRKRKCLAQLRAREMSSADQSRVKPQEGLVIRGGSKYLRSDSDVVPLQKPAEPDYT